MPHIHSALPPSPSPTTVSASQPVTDSLLVSNSSTASATTTSSTTPAAVHDVQVLVHHTAKNPDILVDLAWQMAPGLAVGLAVGFVLIFGRYWLIRWLESFPAPSVTTPLPLPGATPPVPGQNQLSWRQRWRNRIRAWHILLLPILHGTRPWFILAMVLSSALEVLPLNPLILALIGDVATVASLTQLGIWLVLIMQALAHRQVSLHPHDGARATTVSTLVTIGSFFIWALMLVWGLNDLGFNVKTLVAGLGIGGVAVAFASQNLLQNILASVTMVFDSPFALGDLINSKDVTGVIEKIGLRNSIIRSLRGEQVIIANNDLLNGRIANYGRMRARRVDLNFSLFYDTSPDEAALVPKLVEDVIKSVKNARADHCHIAGIGVDRIEVQGAYFVESANYAVYKDVQEAIILGIMRTLSANGISLGFPAKIVHPLPFDYISAQPAGAPAPARPAAAVEDPSAAAKPKKTALKRPPDFLLPGLTSRASAPLAPSPYRRALLS